MNILLGLALTAMAAAQAGNSGPQHSSPTPDLNTIVTRLEQAQAGNRAATRAYVVIRDYQLFKAGDPDPKTTVVAEVSFMPPDSKSYEIRQTSGSGRGEKIVRKVLDHEKDMADDRGEHDLSRKNYDFTYIGEKRLNGARCYLLRIHAKHDDKNLVDGVAWIDASTFLPRRVEGELSKSPSWWITQVQVRMDYGPVAGMWLPLANRADANIRLFGKHIFIGRDVQYQTSNVVATVNGSGAAMSTPSRRHSPASTAGVFVPE